MSNNDFTQRQFTAMPQDGRTSRPNTALPQLNFAQTFAAPEWRQWRLQSSSSRVQPTQVTSATSAVSTASPMSVEESAREEMGNSMTPLHAMEEVMHFCRTADAQLKMANNRLKLAKTAMNEFEGKVNMMTKAGEVLVAHVKRTEKKTNAYYKMLHTLVPPETLRCHDVNNFMDD